MKDKMDMEMDLGQLLRVLKGKVKYIILITLTIALVGTAVTVVTFEPMYQAHAKMRIDASGNSGQNITPDQLASSMKLVDDCAIIICSRSVMEPIIEQLGLDETCESLAEKIKIESINGTQYMQITVEYAELETAKSITKSILDLAPGQVYNSLEAGSLKVLDGVYSSGEPTKLSMAKTILLYTAIGFVFSCGLFVVIHMLDNSFHSERELRHMLNLPVLGVIPDVDTCARSNKNNMKGV